ncbi:MAG: aminopeptidase P family N-terminal domain-containing protein, partial [Methanobacteriota archaeon]
MNRTRLDDRLADLDDDGYLLDASQEDANQLYLSGFTGPDPFLTLYADGEVHLLVSGLEYGRAKTEAAADTVERHADYDYEYGGREERSDMYAAFVREKGVESVSMPPRGPVGTADALRERGIDVSVDTDDRLRQVRAVKTDGEVDAIREAQKANEAAMRAAEELIAGADVAGEDVPADGDVEPGVLLRDGEPLTSERVTEEIEVTLLRHG